MTEYETGHCWACGARTRYRATTVPRVNGEPLCQRCVTRVNELLTEADQLPAIVVEGTYPDESA